MRAQFTTLLLFFLLFLPLSGCGQKGPLYISPTCSPVAADGQVRELTDENGSILPPCRSDESAPGETQELPQDDQFGNDEFND